MSSARGELWRWKWRVALVAVVIVALVFVATRGSAAEDATYRTAIVATGDVTQTLSASGSIESASRYDLTFQTDGDVVAVNVKPGDTVSAGQVLATLDDADLQDAVDAAQDALTQAQDTLDSDLDAQTNASRTSGSSSSATGKSEISPSGKSGSGDSTSSAPTVTSPEITAAEQAVKDAQGALLAQADAATVALDQAKADAANAATVCATFTALDPSDPTAVDALTACQSATSTATSSQQAAADAQAALMDAVTALNKAVSTLLGAIDAETGTPSTTPSATPSAAPASSTTGTQPVTVTLVAFTSGRAATAADGGPASAASGTQNSVPSAEDILADKAAITEATANLAVATAQLDYASLATPVAGTVVAVGLAEGDAVTAADTSTAITVVADNTYLVRLAVSLTQARMLQVGQAASLTLLSDNQVVDGTVSSVSNVNSGNSFQQSYAVTIAVPDPGFAIRIGTATRMKITVASATDVLVVPTSAVSDASGDATVQVIGDDGTAQSVSVTTGAIGAEYTEITSGLDAGQEVVLADLSVKLSTGDDDSTSTGGLLSGLSDDSSTSTRRQLPDGFQPPDGFTGGGNFPGGFPGGQG